MESVGVTPEFWKNRRVFLTGHTGFKGAWLSLWLQSMGAKVFGYSLEVPTSPSLYEASDVASGMESITADVRDFPTLQRTLKEFSPEVIFHLAAQSLVRPSYEHPIDTYDVNVMGTVKVLEACRHLSGLKAVTIVTSDKCYRNVERAEGYHEDEPLGGYDPYSSSKGCAEIVTSAMTSSFFNPTNYQSHGVAVASARAGNVIGGGDWATDRLVPDLIRGALAGEQVPIRYPGAVRPWQLVLEPLRGYLMLAERLATEGARFSGAWNFGPRAEDERPVSELVRLLGERWGPSMKWQQDQVAQVHEAGILRLNCDKAAAQLHWHPTLLLEDTLDFIASWYKKYHQSPHQMRNKTIEQIKDYVTRAATQQPFKKAV